MANLLPDNRSTSYMPSAPLLPTSSWSQKAHRDVDHKIIVLIWMEFMGGVTVTNYIERLLQNHIIRLIYQLSQKREILSIVLLLSHLFITYLSLKLKLFNILRGYDNFYFCPKCYVFNSIISMRAPLFQHNLP